MGALRSKKEISKTKPLVLTFRNGIQELTNSITQHISGSIVQDEVKSISELEHGFEVQTLSRKWKAKQVISCLPAYILSTVLEEIAPDTAQNLSEISYSPMLSTQLIFEEGDIQLPQSGFGFLIPRKENIRLLGAIWKSSIFPELSGKDKIHFTLMTGGAHDDAILKDPVQEVEQEVIQEFKSLMGIDLDPVLVKSKLWEKAIPQFRVGYKSVHTKIEEAENAHPGLYIGGNFRWGVSVPDCVSGAREFTDSLK